MLKAYDPNAQETEAGGLQVWGLPGQLSDISSQNKI